MIARDMGSRWGAGEGAGLSDEADRVGFPGKGNLTREGEDL